MIVQKIIEEGKITSLSAEGGVGSTGEAHLAEYKGEKYLLRICKDEKTAKYYQFLYRKFKKYKFLPKLIERNKHYVLFEFIKGRQCRDKGEDKKIIEQIGKICGLINQTKAKKVNYSIKTGLRIEEISKGIINRVLLDKALELNNKLKQRVILKTALDASDVTNDNFIVSKNKVYFVDIEAIKPNLKGYGMVKSFFVWFKSEKEQKAFIKGYKKVNSLKYFTKDYESYAKLYFLASRINYMHMKGEKEKLEIAIFRLKSLLKNTI